MSTNRMIRINELLRREIGEALFRLIDADEIDLSAVTVTHVVTSPDLKKAKVFISIRDHHQERISIMKQLRNYRAELQERIGRNVFLKFTPRLQFVLDTSIEKGDRVLSILADMETSSGEGKETGELSEQ